MTVHGFDKQEKLYGRKLELAKFGQVIEQPGIRIIMGPPGMGKTSLLTYLKIEAERIGRLAVYAKVERNECIENIVDKIVRKLEEKNTSPNLKSLGKIIEERGKPLLLLMDDTNKMKNVKGTFGKLAAFAQKNTVIITSTIWYQGGDENTLLKALDRHDIREMMENILEERGLKMGEECFNAVAEDSSGNPGLASLMCTQLRDSVEANARIISKAHYLHFLPRIIDRLEDVWFGELYQETTGTERKILKALANSGSIRALDLAKKTSMRQGPLIALIRRLGESGQVMKLERGKYDLFARIYGTYVKQRIT